MTCIGRCDLTIGRPTKCTPKAIARIAKVLALGGTINSACRAGGIDTASYYSWLRRGEEGEEPFVGFLHAVKESQAVAEHKALSVINEAMLDQWQAAAWLLERRYPDDYGRRQRMDIGADKNQELEVVVKIGGKSSDGE